VRAAVINRGVADRARAATSPGGEAPDEAASGRRTRRIRQQAHYRVRACGRSLRLPRTPSRGDPWAAGIKGFARKPDEDWGSHGGPRVPCSRAYACRACAPRRHLFPSTHARTHPRVRELATLQARGESGLQAVFVVTGGACRRRGVARFPRATAVLHGRLALAVSLHG